MIYIFLLSTLNKVIIIIIMMIIIIILIIIIIIIIIMIIIIIIIWITFIINKLLYLKQSIRKTDRWRK